MQVAEPEEKKEEVKVEGEETKVQDTPKTSKVETTDNGKAELSNEALLKAQKDLEDYQSRVEPVLETILGDPELYKTVLNKHQSRLGVTSEEEDKKEEETKEETPKPSPLELDNRNAQVKQIVDTFSTEVGLDKLAPDAQKDINIRIGNVLARMIDPTGQSKKALPQLINEVSLMQLPNLLRDAHYLATREEREKAIAQKAIQEYAQNESGVIGNMPSDSAEAEEVTLSQKERETAKKMGISEEKYLEGKKSVVANRGQIY